MVAKARHPDWRIARRSASRAAASAVLSARRAYRLASVLARRRWRGGSDDDTWQGLRRGILLGLAFAVLVLPAQHDDASATSRLPARAPLVEMPPAPAPARQLDWGGEQPSADAHALAQWVVTAGDNGDRPFAVLDKVAARVYLFEPEGRLFAASPVLLGWARGDDTVPGIGNRPIKAVRPFERTTPAGRFEAQPGRNLAGDDVLWVDYDAAVSMHPLRATDPRERRPERMASRSALDNRISYGCINLPVAFFHETFWPRFGRGPSVIYVLPEVYSLEHVFPALVAMSRPVT